MDCDYDEQVKDLILIELFWRIPGCLTFGKKDVCGENMKTCWLKGEFRGFWMFFSLQFSVFSPIFPIQKGSKRSLELKRWIWGFMSKHSLKYLEQQTSLQQNTAEA